MESPATVSLGPPPEPPDPDFDMVFPMDPPVPPVPPDPPPIYLVRAFSLFPLAMTHTPDLDFQSLNSESRGCDVPLLFSGVSSSGYGCLVSRPSLQVSTQISILKSPSRMASKYDGDGGLPVSTSDTSFAFGLLSPVVYRSLFECIDWPSIGPCLDFPTTPPCKVLHVHLSYFFSTYSTTVEWFRQLGMWVMLELRFMILTGDIPMSLVSFGSTFAISSSIYFALARSTAVCSSSTGFIPDVGVVFAYLSSWWQVEGKLIVIFVPMNMDVAGYDFSLVPRLNQSSLLIFPPIRCELDVQASLVLQGSSSHRMLFSAYGAVCVILRVTLDAVFEETYDVVVIRFHMVVVIRFHMVPFCDLYHHSILFVIAVVVYLVVNNHFVSSFVGV